VTSPAGSTRELAIDVANRYGGTIHHHHDGDTIYVETWDPIIQAHVIVGVRVRGVQAPELGQPGGREVAAAVAAHWPPGTAAVWTDAGPYPRAGHVTATPASAGADVATWLLDCGYAVPWDGTGPKPPVPWPPVKAPAHTI
jgi:endonuclease YncB( thermonuclease family)